MQQAKVAIQGSTSGSGKNLPSSFVINLCASTTPVALTHPNHPELKRFTFFVSRRREEGRERFRLHMGYFSSQEEAERLLEIVRDIYPAAWAGLAPGQRLRAAVAEAEAAGTAAEVAPAALEEGAPQVQPYELAGGAAPPVITVAPVITSPLITSAPVGSAPVGSALGAIPAEPTPAMADSTVVAPLAMHAAPSPPAADNASEPITLSLVADDGRRAAPDARKAVELAVVTTLSNVRETIASLDDAPRAPVLRPIPEIKPPANTIPVRGVLPPAATSMLDDAAVLQVLEAHRGAAPKAPVAPPARVEVASFAVQLMWSVKPIDLATVPQLAIFRAYTLYGAEGNRSGRRWYGLRLGFFTDAISAKQVAQYVRSEFSAVSVVPVTARERERAKIAATRPMPTVDATSRRDAAEIAATPATASTAVAATGGAHTGREFNFIETAPLSGPPGAGVTARAGRGAPGKRAKLRTQRPTAGPRARNKPMTLEETLEILGAGQLEMDDGRSASINDTDVGRQRPAPNKSRPSRLGRLFERLSERLGNG